MIKILDKVKTKSGEGVILSGFCLILLIIKLGFPVALFVQVFYINMFWKIKLKK